MELLGTSLDEGAEPVQKRCLSALSAVDALWFVEDSVDSFVHTAEVARRAETGFQLSAERVLIRHPAQRNSADRTRGAWPEVASCPAV